MDTAQPPCPNSTPLTVTVTPTVTGPGSPSYAFAGTTAPDITVGSDGSLIFTRSTKRILVTMVFSDPAWTWQFAGQATPMSFALRKGGAKDFVPESGNAQVQWLRVAQDRSSFTFCYRNRDHDSHQSFPQSEYGLYMQLGGQTYIKDPIISNGGQPQL